MQADRPAERSQPPRRRRILHSPTTRLGAAAESPLVLPHLTLPKHVLAVVVAAVAGASVAGCGPAPVEDRLGDYDRLVAMARAADLADPPVPAFQLGMSALPDSARHLMLDLGLYSVTSTENGWAWARGRRGLVKEAPVYTLVPDDEFGGHEPLVRSGLGGTWVRGLYLPGRIFDEGGARPPGR